VSSQNERRLVANAWKISGIRRKPLNFPKLSVGPARLIKDWGGIVDSAAPARRAFITSAACVAGMLLAAFGLNACASAVAEDQPAPTASVETATSNAQNPSPAPSASAKSVPVSGPPSKAFCKDLAKLLNSDAALQLVAAEVNLDSDEAHAALLAYIPKLQHFIDGLGKDTPNNIRATLGQFNTNLQNKILQRTITPDDLDLVKYTDDDIRHYAVTTCQQRLTY